MHALIVSTTFTCLAGVFVAIRLWTRLGLIKTPGYDDLLVVLALISSGIFYALVLVERHYGLGIFRVELDDETIRKQMHYLWLSIPFYNLSLVLSKLSALVLYIRIFPSRRFRLAVYLVVGFLVLSGLWMVLSGFVFCVPVKDFWSLDPTVKQSHCLSMGAVWFTNAGIQIFTDIVILILPMPMVSNLQLPQRQKVGIMLVFGVGIFVIATSSARLYELSIMVQGSDITRTNAYAAVWSSIEANVSIICACLSPLHPLISRVFAFFFRPQPLHSSPASKAHSNTTYLTESRKHSIHDHGIFFNDSFFAGAGGYSASIAKVHTNEEEHENEEGIRVVRELRMVTDSVPPSPRDASVHSRARIAPTTSREGDIEMGARPSAGSGETTTTARIEWDLGDFEFPDYKERINCPI